MSKPKLIEQIENAGGVFVATYNTTTYQEIKNAYDSGKDVLLYHSGKIYGLAQIPDGTTVLWFYDRIGSAPYATTYNVCYGVDTTNTWFADTGFCGKVPTSLYLESNGSTTAISSSSRYYRPILVSTSEPTASDGNIGDIWIQYDAN